MAETTTKTTTTENKTEKRGRKVMTFHDIVAAQPSELDLGMVAFLERVFNVTVDPKAVKLIGMASVREMYHNSDEYKDAQSKRRERIDSAKAKVTELSVDSLLAKLSPEQVAALIEKLSTK